MNGTPVDPPFSVEDWHAYDRPTAPSPSQPSPLQPPGATEGPNPEVLPRVTAAPAPPL